MRSNMKRIGCLSRIAGVVAAGLCLILFGIPVTVFVVPVGLAMIGIGGLLVISAPVTQLFLRGGRFAVCPYCGSRVDVGHKRHGGITCRFCHGRLAIRGNDIWPVTGLWP